MKNIKTVKAKSLFALLLAVIIALTPLSVCAASYAEDMQKVYESNFYLINYAAGKYDPQDFAKPYEGDDYADVNAKAREITADCTTDREKSFAINEWISANIYYDYDYLNHGAERPSAAPKDVLETKLAVCEGYATLMRAMCRAVGVPCRMVYGQSIKPTSYFSEENPTYLENAALHGWNEVYFEGAWRMLDTTWDSANKYEYGQWNTVTPKSMYFNLDVKTFSQRHYILNYYDYLNIDDYCLKPTADGIELTGYTGNEKNIVVPDELEIASIGYKAFYQNTDIVSFTAPSTLRKIDSLAFYHCTNLEAFNFNNGLLSIGYSAFDGCEKLKEVSIPDTVTTLDSGFSYCKNMEKLKIGNGIEKIPSLTFAGCHNLKTVELGNGLKEISSNAFSSCNSLETVRFNGTRAEWDAINIVTTGNFAITNANVITNDDVQPTETTTTTQSTTTTETATTTESTTAESTTTTESTTATTESTTKKDDNTSTTKEETTVIPEETTTDFNNQNGSGSQGTSKCDHICHKGGISAVIYKIIRVFWKLFGTNKYCACGAAHY